MQSSSLHEINQSINESNAFQMLTTQPQNNNNQKIKIKNKCTEKNHKEQTTTNEARRRIII